MIELSEDNLKEIISQNDKVMVQYGATWCGNCRLTKPKFKRLSEETDGVEFVYVDAEKYPESRGLAKVENLPTFAGFVNGTLLTQKAGNKGIIINEILDEITNH